MMAIELLVIPGCPNAEAAAELIAAAVLDSGIRAAVTHTVVTTQDQARRRRFVGSPTILLNGSDPFAHPRASPALACRLYSTSDGPRGVPELQALRQAIMRAATV